ncbi:MAG: hypothetical protein CSB15_00080 [Clostridiales bacterium]|nr:MAG: hypothetical protein CSB15_00080 [Clostridiales bacterium]
MNKKKIAFFIFGLVTFGLLFLSISKMAKPIVTHVNPIYKNERVDFNDIFEGSRYISLNVDSKRKELLDTGLIEDVVVEKAFSKKIFLKVTWKKPIVAIESAGKYYLIAKEGYVIDISDNAKKLDVINNVIIKSAKLGHPIVTEDNYQFSAAVELVKLMNLNKSAINIKLLNNKTKKTKIMIENNNLVQFLNDKYVINYGDGRNIREKFEKMVNIVNELADKRGVSSGVINLTVPNNVSYKAWTE